VVAAGGTEADATDLVDALAAAIAALTGGVAQNDGVELDFRSPGGAVEVTMRYQGKSSVVTHPLPAAKG
jgi:hypothetical protein